MNDSENVRKYSGPHTNGGEGLADPIRGPTNRMACDHSKNHFCNFFVPSVRPLMTPAHGHMRQFDEPSNRQTRANANTVIP